MKIIYVTICLLLMPGLRLCLAQPMDDLPPGPPPEERGRPQNGRRMAPPGFQPASPLHRVMQEMRQNNPAEFERLQELRVRDPGAFRSEAKDILQKAFLEKMKAERPVIHDALTQLDEEDRDWIFNRLAGPGFPGMGGSPHGPEKGIRKGEYDVIKGLINQYRRSDLPEEKEAFRAQLRQYLSEQYDQRLNDRKAQITEAELKLEQIKKSFDQSVADKDSFIDEKLAIWLNGKPPRDRGPPDNRSRFD